MRKNSSFFYALVLGAWLTFSQSFADLQTILAEYDNNRAVSAISVGRGSYLLLAEVSHSKDGKATGKPILMLYRLQETKEGIETVWKSALLGLRAVNIGELTLADSKWGYVVAGQGSGNAKNSGAVVLVDKATSKILWRRWLEPTDKNTFFIGGLTANDREILVVGSDSTLKAEGNKEVPNASASTPMLYSLSPDKGVATAFPLSPEAKTPSVGRFPYSIASDEAGENFMIAGLEVFQGENKPLALALDKNKKEVWHADFTGSTGWLTGVVAKENRFHVWGQVDGVSTVRTFYADRTDRTLTATEMKIASVYPAASEVLFLAGQGAGSSAEVLESQLGRDLSHPGLSPEGVSVRSSSMLAAIPRPTGGFVGFGDVLVANTDHRQLWIVQVGAPDLYVPPVEKPLAKLAAKLATNGPVPPAAATGDMKKAATEEEAKPADAKPVRTMDQIIKDANLPPDAMTLESPGPKSHPFNGAAFLASGEDQNFEYRVGVPAAYTWSKEKKTNVIKVRVNNNWITITEKK